MKGKCFVIVLVISIIVILMCSSCSKKKQEAQPSNCYSPSYVGRPYTPVTSSYRHDTIDRELSEKVLQAAQTSVSKWYQLGYDRGYDDGEDDAVCRNGYQGQYDDSNHYHGWKKKEYEEGYCDGYEAGFDDNMADDGSDEIYE